MSHHNKRKKIVELERAPEINQKTKDSLHTEANKYGKAFFSPKYKVNVDPEDGVLSNRPIYSDGSKLTYESIDKPHSESNLNMNASPFDFVGRAARMATRAAMKGPRSVLPNQAEVYNKVLGTNVGAMQRVAQNVVGQQPPVNPSTLDPTGGAALMPPSNEAANMYDPATRALGGQIPTDMFGTPLERQRSVSKKYCKKNK